MKHAPNILLALVVAVFSVTMYLMLFEKPWLTYLNIPFPTELAKAREGETIPLRVKRCSTANVKRTFRVARSMVRVNEPGSSPMLLPDTISSIEPGCIEMISSFNKIPLGTPPGKYIIIGIVEIQGTFSEMMVEWHTQEFEVIK